jgi:TniQ
VNGIFVGPVRDRRWPLHPQPSDWEDLETWVRRIAEMYGVSYDAFLLNALGHAGRGARDLDQAPAGVLARLSAGTGIPIERLMDMTSPRVVARMISRTRELLQTPEGQAALDVLNAMASRQRRRVSAVRGF